MLADQLDYVVGVDPHRDEHALAVVEVRSGVVVFETAVAADSGGYAARARGRRGACAWPACVRGRGHRLVRRRPDALPAGRGERVFEVGRLRRERRSGGKTDALDAVRAARSVLTQERPATPRSKRANARRCGRLMAAREGAVERRSGPVSASSVTCSITTPEPLRSELRPLTRGTAPRSVSRRPGPSGRRRSRAARQRCSRCAAVARRIQQLTVEERELAREIEDADAQARTAAARPARRRAAPRRPGRALLVPQRPDPQRSRVRAARRRRPDPRLLRPNDPLPTRPQQATANSTEPCT